MRATSFLPAPAPIAVAARIAAAKERDPRGRSRNQFAEAVLDNGKFGTRTVRFETGRLAQQAQGAVAAYLDEDTMILSATSAGKHPRDGFDFFPLTVDVEERSYAAGKIPGSFFRREGRPSTEAILVCRLIDRPLRPTFVEGLRNEVQIVITVLSIAPDEFYDALAINAASASTQISGLPFYGPVAGIRLALIGDQWVAFPKYSQLAEAVFDLTVAGRLVTDKDGNEDVAIMMVEAEATEGSWELIRGGATKPDEAVVAQGLEASKPFLKQLVKAQQELADAVGEGDPGVPAVPAVLATRPTTRSPSLAYDELKGVYQIADKVERQNADDALKERVKVAIDAKVEAGELQRRRHRRWSAPPTSRSARRSCARRVLTEGIRIDGRGLTDIRALDAEVQVIPRVHGSAIFQRGETQILGVTTLNMLKMEQQIDSLAPVKKKRYLHHYNFPPYSTGETGRVGSPKRREIGHGFLAERALVPVLPTPRGVPLRDPSGLRGAQLQRLDLDGLRLRLDPLAAQRRCAAARPGRRHRDGPHLRRGRRRDPLRGADRHPRRRRRARRHGLQGRRHRATSSPRSSSTPSSRACPSSVLDGALKQAKEARTAILAVINQAIDGPDEMAPTAPRVISVNIPVDKIGELIGPKGKTINAIQDETGAEISIEEDGTVYIGAVDGPSAEAARAAGARDRQPDQPRGGRAVPRNRRQARDLRRVRLAHARQGRPAAHLRGAQARRWQARRERRRRAQRRPEDPGRDHQDGRPRQAVARAGGRREPTARHRHRAAAIGPRGSRPRPKGPSHGRTAGPGPRCTSVRAAVQSRLRTLWTLPPDARRIRTRHARPCIPDGSVVDADVRRAIRVSARRGVRPPDRPA